MQMIWFTVLQAVLHALEKEDGNVLCQVPPEAAPCSVFPFSAPAASDILSRVLKPAERLISFLCD
jgi:hypothetical protein